MMADPAVKDSLTSRIDKGTKQMSMSDGGVEIGVLMSDKLVNFIATRDRKIAKKQPWSPTPLHDFFTQLLSKGSVTVGGRASCGSGADPTWVIFTSWNEVVQKARSLGYAIAEENIKHKNGSPTRSGGFWNESEYTIPSSALLAARGRA